MSSPPKIDSSKGEDTMTILFAATDLPQNMDQGPLVCIIPTYAALLTQQCYTRHYARLQLRFLADLNQWLLQHRFQIIDLAEPTLQRYLRSRHQRFRPRRDDQLILRRLLQLLRAQGFLAEEVPALPANPHQNVEQDFDRYLTQERGLSMATRINYRPFVHRFLSTQFGVEPACFAGLNANDVIRFIRSQAQKMSPKRAGLMVSALRSFFRYLRVSRRYRHRSGGLRPSYCDLAVFIFAKVSSTSPSSTGITSM